jgi:hypothetical protein
MELNVVPSGNGTAFIGSPFPSPAKVSIRQIFGICLTLTLFSFISAFSISTFTLSLAYIRVTGTVTVMPVVTSTSSLAPTIGIDTLSIERNGKAVGKVCFFSCSKFLNFCHEVSVSSLAQLSYPVLVTTYTKDGIPAFRYTGKSCNIIWSVIV